MYPRRSCSPPAAHPKPRDRPLMWSCMICASTTSPNCPKYSWNWSAGGPGGVSGSERRWEGPGGLPRAARSRPPPHPRSSPGPGLPQRSSAPWAFALAAPTSWRRSARGRGAGHRPRGRSQKPSASAGRWVEGNTNLAAVDYVDVLHHPVCDLVLHKCDEAKAPRPPSLPVPHDHLQRGHWALGCRRP